MPEHRADDVYGAESSGKAERLRIWLGVRPAPRLGPAAGREDPKVPITVHNLRAEGASIAAYVKNGEQLGILDLVDNKAYATTRDLIRAYDGRAKVMWKRNGSVSESVPDQEISWAEMPLPDGWVIGWFEVNQGLSPDRSP